MLENAIAFFYAKAHGPLDEEILSVIDFYPAISSSFSFEILLLLKSFHMLVKNKCLQFSTTWLTHGLHWLFHEIISSAQSNECFFFDLWKRSSTEKKKFFGIGSTNKNLFLFLTVNFLGYYSQQSFKPVHPEFAAIQIIKIAMNKTERKFSKVCSFDNFPF